MTVAEKSAIATKFAAVMACTEVAGAKMPAAKSAATEVAAAKAALGHEHGGSAAKSAAAHMTAPATTHMPAAAPATATACHRFDRNGGTADRNRCDNECNFVHRDFS